MIGHLGQAAAAGAAKFGKKEALVFAGGSFSYVELNTMVEKVAAGLAACGVKQGDIVTLYAGNSWKWIVSYYAIARAGGVINPVNTMLTADELGYVVEDCGAKIVIASEDKDIDTNSLASICYTSGTTGHPKGAMQSHRAIIANGAMTAQMQMRGPQDVVISALPCPHVYANIVMQSMMSYGAKLVLHERFDPAAMLADIEKHQATLIDGVPTMYMYMLNDPAIETTDLSSLTRAYVGGQTMPVATMEAVEDKFNIPLIELWGMTEIAGLGSTHPLYGDNKHGSIGCALPYCDLRIADPDEPEKVFTGDDVGELQVKGPITMMGYFGAEQKTKDTILPSSLWTASKI